MRTQRSFVTDQTGAGTSGCYTIITSSPDVAVKVNVHILFTEKNGKKSNNRKLPLEDGVLATSQHLAGRVNF